jgi:Leucine-rich repeat (LRR) protein
MGSRHYSFSCYCNLEDSKVKINYYFLRAIEGGHLLATISGDSIDIDLGYSTLDLRTVSYDKKVIEFDEDNFRIGQKLTGRIELTGDAHSRDKIEYKFDLSGNFMCILRDSSYNFDNFRSDLYRGYDSIRMLKLREIAVNNPDSVVELHLDYKNYYLAKDCLKSFKKLNRLSLRGFPSVDMDILSNFKSLRELTIEGDSLKEIPEGIGEIKTLESVGFTGPIERVPNSLYTLTNLKVLDLGATNISEISSQIKNLLNLETLNIGYTEITKIPKEIFELQKLNDLTLPDTLVPFKIGTLNFKSIRTLHVSYDFLIYNKENIGKLKDLEWLYPSFVYSSHEEYMDKYGKQIKWLEENLPNVDISGTTYVND